MKFKSSREDPFGFAFFVIGLAVMFIVLAIALTACNPTEPTIVQTQEVTVVTCPTDGTHYTIGSCELPASVMPSGLPNGTEVFVHPANFEAPADYPPNTNPDGTIAMDCPPDVTDYRLCTPR